MIGQEYSINMFIEKSRFTQFQGMNKMQFTDKNGESWLVNIFDTYDIDIVEGKLVTNIDVFFVAHHNTYNDLLDYKELLGKRLVYVRQQRKSANIATYNHIIEHPKFIPTKIYNLHKDEDYSQYCFKDGTYYVKQEYGARSINQFIIDSSKVSLSYFLAKLDISYNEDKNIFAESIKNLVESSKGNIKHIKGNEREENEHAKYKMDYCVHEKFKDIAFEFRVIQSNYGNNIVFLKRERNSSNDGIVDNEINYVELLDIDELKSIYVTNEDYESIRKSLINAFTKNEFFHGSIDLVFNKSGEWTIVETSNQFGSADVPYDIKRNVLRDTIASLVEKCYS